MIGAFAVAATGCVTPGGTRADRPLESQAAPPLPPLTMEGDWSPDQGADPVWQGSFEGDDWAALELARRAGPQGLLSALQSGGKAARAAAKAWPYVSTAWVFRGTWCDHAVRYQPGELSLLLRALGESSAQRDVVGEELEPEALSACGRFLERAERLVASDTDNRFGPLRDALQAAQTGLGIRNVTPKP